MAAITPAPERIRAFRDGEAFERWLAAHHETAPELYLRIYKKDSGIATITYAQALDIALCWGWIDGLKKSYDEQSFLQRFTPRKAKSAWSRINCGHVERLIAAGRMTPHGLAHVNAAKADGRWDAAYASPRDAQIPPDLMAAIEADGQALATFRALTSQNRFALAYRLGKLKTDAARAKNIAKFVEMLHRGETLYPNGRAARITEREVRRNDGSPRARTSANASGAANPRASAKPSVAEKATASRKPPAAPKSTGRRKARVSANALSSVKRKRV
jgi:uncharacterized protein YdeI (YjbR/CyaY-like superfamily)